MKKYVLVGAGAVLFALMLLGDGYGLARFLRAPSAPVSKAAVSDHVKVAPLSKRVFVKLPKFVVTIPAPSSGAYGSTYLQIAMSFATSNAQAARDFAKVRPIIKSDLIGKIMESGRELHNRPNQERNQLAMQGLSIVNRVVFQADPKTGPAPFNGGYITSFTIQ